MTTLDLIGRITETGQLDIQLPAGTPAGNVRVRIDLTDSAWENQPWTEAELEALMTPHPKTGAEIVALLQSLPPLDFVDSEIEDPTEWVKAQRRKESGLLAAKWDEHE